MSREHVPEFDIVLESQRLSEVTHPVNDYDLEVLFTCFCRRPEFFQEARRVLKPHYFDPGAEIQYLLLWEALSMATDSYGPATPVTVSSVMLTLLAQRQGMLPP